MSPEIFYIFSAGLVPVLLAITLHEAAHGWVAYRLGDNTAKKEGRITANPIAHIDMMGTIIVPAVMTAFTPFLMGWAKPVPVDVRQFKAPLLDMGIVAAAGPMSNFIMATFWAAFMMVVATFPPSETVLFFWTMGKYGVWFNILLILINLLPIPPLDGGRVVAGILPPGLATQYLKIEPFGIWIVIALLVSGVLSSVVIDQFVQFVNMFSYLFDIRIPVPALPK